jgi:hypothetical protein
MEQDCPRRGPPASMAIRFREESITPVNVSQSIPATREKASRRSPREVLGILPGGGRL